MEIIREPEISGEIADRPGINQVWAGIRDHRWDAILAEESSRLYRHMTFASQFFDTAVDAGIRVICPTDCIDTADEDWPERLHSALGHHGRANHFTRNRIKRAQESRWLSGAAMGPLAIGYRRRPTIPASASQPARGPFFDFIDDQLKPVIVEIFARTANDEPPWAIAEWLTSIKFPKAKNRQKPEWTAGNVISLLRRPIYRGEEVFRTKFSKRELRTGRSKLVWNAKNAVLTRKSEHLRMVSDWLWYQANTVIDRRCARLHPKRGAEHPLAGKPLDSRKLLIKSVVVSREKCSRISEQLQLIDFLIVGKGLSVNKPVPTSVPSDLFESVVAAMYLDGGLECVRGLVERLLEPEIIKVASGETGSNHKSLLRQLAQRDFGLTPTYDVVEEEEGPDHSKSFHISAQIGTRRYAPAWGRNKKEAEQRAASNALAELGIERTGG